ncbi:HMG domain-containing protein 3 [Entelurus aequoreus]|uniref:HMG domain-containing protein 3 n=1 Tax=Entelurus aequoreus TaxID=161455 RepID=UPI002B1D9D94|nr:HMG domain-containing protein 3 [Entelurus aequoreus]XP_061901934.1 HMG domain-containing protein 3 [Entelurus aequoreus]
MEKVEVYEVVKLTEEVESSYIQATSSMKRKRKNKDESEVKPKKPRSAYLLYYFDVHQIMQQEMPNQPQSEINKRISENWKRLSVAEKGFYLEKAKLEKEGIDTLTHSPSKDLPGFRKIRPRASYFILAKDHQAGGSQAEPLDPPAEEGVPSLTQDPKKAQMLGLACKVEVSQRFTALDNLGKHTEDTLPASPSSSIMSVSGAATDVSFSQSSVEADSVGIKGSEIGDAPGVNSVMTREMTQMVAIVPNQLGLNAVGSVMMVSMGAKEEPNARPSYKMPVKTYTRRGRGRCLNPSCSFVYVTRHKPTKCPECGSHLGGKWIAAENKSKPKRHQDTKSAVAQAKCGSSCQVTTQERNANVGKSKRTRNRKEGHKKQRSDAVSADQTAEGTSKSQEKTQNVKEITVRSQDNVQKKPVRPILPAFCKTGAALFQVITVPSVSGKFQTPNNNKSSTEPQHSFSGLKPGTLKQLGQEVPAKQGSLVPSSQPSVADKKINIVSILPFSQVTVDDFDLGLSTARGRGRCKNPHCDYIYKNRHKPLLCPKCGCDLTQRNPKGTKSVTLVDPYQPLSPAQKDLQRQSTLQLLRHSLQILESEAELQETLTLIQELNSLQIVLVQPGLQEEDDNVETETLVESGWPQFYESSATQCGLCNNTLYKGAQNTIAGQEDCWLLTETLIQTASLQLKVCLNSQCLALHSFTDLNPGLFNIGNKLLVSIDLLLKIRDKIRTGLPPSQVAMTVLDHVPNHPVHTLSPEVASQIQELLLVGYWAFESLTVRDYNDMICGICGVAPKLEIAKRRTDNVLELKNVEFTWPQFSVLDEVHVDDFWLTMESEAIEQAAFPAEFPITRMDASIIAPFIPPLMRSSSVINTEKDKDLTQTPQPSGSLSVLVRLIHDGELKLDKMEELSEDELRAILERCGASITADSTKTELLTSLISMCTLAHSGLPTAPQPPGHLTAGKLSKVCHHKVVCASKYLVRGETARDHVDLLVSSRYWPPVYVSDCAQQVALCTDMQYPEKAAQMWGRNQGCFSDPFDKPESVSCAELQEKWYAADLSVSGGIQQHHPLTKSSSCWLLHPPPPSPSKESALPEHRSMSSCKDLDHLISAVTSIHKEEDEEETPSDKSLSEKPQGCLSASPSRTQPVFFDNPAHYYLYNRLLDFLSSRDIVSVQISQVVKLCQPGEVVIRDALYRLGVANIHTEREEDESSLSDRDKPQTAFEVSLPDPEPSKTQ